MLKRILAPIFLEPRSFESNSFPLSTIERSVPLRAQHKGGFGLAVAVAALCVLPGARAHGSARGGLAHTDWAPNTHQPWSLEPWSLGNPPVGHFETPAAKAGGGGSRVAGISDSADAARLYDDANADLKAGNMAAAQAQFEQLIARFPDSLKAAEARLRLIEIFRAEKERRAAAYRPAARAAGKEGSGTGPGSPNGLGAGGAAGAAQGQRSASLPPRVAPGGGQPPAEPLARDGDDFKISVGDRVFFDAQSAALGSREHLVMTAQANWLKRRPEAIITLEAHADDRGSRDLNMAIARERGEAVKSALIRDGVAASRIIVQPLGQDLPVALCSDQAGVSARRNLDQKPEAPRSLEACSAHNRRVVTIVTWPELLGGRRSSANGSRPPLSPERQDRPRR